MKRRDFIQSCILWLAALPFGGFITKFILDPTHQSVLNYWKAQTAFKTLYKVDGTAFFPLWPFNKPVPNYWGVSFMCLGKGRLSKTGHNSCSANFDCSIETYEKVLVPGTNMKRFFQLINDDK